ncbi:MAG: family 78 glycoside hydrolase catalytic domain, partial [Lachnospiraceae bacterium]|nr:family 78 glycoside hydrolase catalytic domain [Lachnospiraceae bacterium]
MIRSCQVNHMTNPLGFDFGTPVFSWKGDLEKYRLRIAADESFREILYDSGTAALDSLCTCPKLALSPRTRYYWTVGGEIQWFETAKMDEPWQAAWISCDRSETRHPLFSKQIDICKDILSARAYICGLGLYEASINGSKLGQEYFAPFCTDYNTWVQYQTYDITDLLAKENTFSVLLGNGWYGGRFGFNSRDDSKPYFGDNWKLLAEIHICYSDGTEEVIGTDESWTVTRSNITFSNIYDGERVDGTLESLLPVPALLCDGPKGKLSARVSPPVTAHEVFSVKEVIHTPAGETVMDFGQNMAGIFQIRLQLPAGEKLRLQFGETLQDGNFYRDNLRTAKAEYLWVSDGKEHVLEPKFTFYGFRFMKIEGAELPADDIKAIALYSAIPPIGRISTGNEPVNQLISNILWGQKSNFLDVPTDCPQRDERMGWTGDAQVFAPTACYMTNAAAFYHKYLTDLNHEQAVLGGAVPNVIPSLGQRGISSAWGDAAVIIPRTVYQFTGDTSFLASHYEGMKAWVLWCKAQYDAGTWLTQFHFGDWLALDGPKAGDGMLGGTDTAFVAAAYLVRSAQLCAEAAHILGLKEDNLLLRQIGEMVLEDLQQEFFSPRGRCCIDTQTGHLLTLAFNLHPNRKRAAAALKKKLAQSNGKADTGFVGTPLLCPTLSAEGMHKEAYKLLLNEEIPGWLYQVKMGATTVWERWNSVMPDGLVSSTGMNSLNHYAYGS